jgi:hypothetical protein
MTCDSTDFSTSAGNGVTILPGSGNAARMSLMNCAPMPVKS